VIHRELRFREWKLFFLANRLTGKHRFKSFAEVGKGFFADDFGNSPSNDLVSAEVIVRAYDP
jgi:hypothetical protein